MKNHYGSVVLVTGASSGIGRAVAVSLAKQGFKVYGTSRNPDSQQNMQYKKGFLKMIQLDVCDQSSIDRAIEHIRTREGSIDILINNAGFAVAGSIEDTTMEEAFRQLDTNFMGTLRMCHDVLPIMRQRQKGLIINIGSVMGLIALPFQSMYSASKYAIEALTESLRLETRPYGIRAVVVEPGDTKTDLTKNRHFALQSEESVYSPRFKASIEKMMRDEQNGPGPEKVVKTVTKLINQKKPPVRVVVGMDYKLLVLLRRILPSRLVEFILDRMY